MPHPHTGTLFYGGNQNDVTDRSNDAVIGRGNLEHTVPGFNGQRLVREVSQGTYIRGCNQCQSDSNV